MRNIEQYAEAGQKKIQDNAHYDLQVSDMQTLLDLANDAGMIEALERAFHAGVEAGARIQAKRSAALDPKE